MSATTTSSVLFPEFLQKIRLSEIFRHHHNSLAGMYRFPPALWHKHIMGKAKVPPKYKFHILWPPADRMSPCRFDGGVSGSSCHCDFVGVKNLLILPAKRASSYICTQKPRLEIRRSGMSSVFLLLIQQPLQPYPHILS